MKSLSPVAKISQNTVPKKEIEKETEKQFLCWCFAVVSYNGNRSLKIYIASSRVPFLVWGRAATTVAPGFS